VNKLTELEIYKFIQNNDGIEIDWRSEKHLYMWIPFYNLKEFTDLLGYDYLCEGGEAVSLQHDCVCVDILDICECFDIEPTNILPKED
jgi:hypothetical protein